ncbi:hypothetical protein JCM30471_12610 [Desulfuromonas carbonis]
MRRKGNRTIEAVMGHMIQSNSDRHFSLSFKQGCHPVGQQEGSGGGKTQEDRQISK